MPIPKKIARPLTAMGLMPTTRLGWFTLYLGGLEALLVLLEYILVRAGALGAVASLAPWTRFLGFVFVVLFTFLALRWFRNYVMWRLRNRLIVTYLFIGGVPIVLVVLMIVLSAYFLFMQFAIYLTLSEIQTQVQRLQVANAGTAQELQASRGVARLRTAGVRSGDDVFPGRTVTLLPQPEAPAWIKDGFSNLVVDGNAVYLRAANTISDGNRRVTVISSVPVDQKLLAQIARGLGPVTLYVPSREVRGKMDVNVQPGRGVLVTGDRFFVASGGPMPDQQRNWDTGFGFYGLVPLTDWKSGESFEAFLVGTTRVSTLYSRLTVSTSRWADVVRIALIALAITLGVIMVIALIIGIRLTRTITFSVANLYEATQHVNRGDFSHRIQVKERDQLAELQVAFNTMTESVEKLIAEQKEKERLQSELAIAQEVQAQLFPTALSSTRTLELHGICRPARIVSGDYYDFLPYGSEQIGVALGDISGKGISAALLMATIHSAVRAYEQEQLIAVSAARVPVERATSGSLALAVSHTPPQSPSQVLWLLNRQLFKTTPPEKYATLFLGFYDGHARQMTYSNAGHLPPLILGANGSIRRLETGGTVVGLFDSMEYEEATVNLNPGDIFVAFSDGITEPENEFGEFGEARLIETIETCRDQPLDRIADHVLAAIQDWIGSTEQPDDITLVLARPRE